MTNAKLYAVIYRTGGTENFRWCRVLDLLTREEAATKADELVRMGYPALIHDAALLDAIGLPETFSGEDEIDESRYTNHYLCPNDGMQWDDDWSCMCDDRCPACDAEIEPYASTDNADDSEVIHCQEVYDRAE